MEKLQVNRTLGGTLTEVACLLITCASMLILLISGTTPYMLLLPAAGGVAAAYNLIMAYRPWSKGAKVAEWGENRTLTQQRVTVKVRRITACQWTLLMLMLSVYYASKVSVSDGVAFVAIAIMALAFSGFTSWMVARERNRGNE